MQILKTVEEVIQARRSFSDIGFVPTMGYLHEGHLSLIRQAKSDNKAVAVSIFVNPTQFGPNEDFESYPRDLEGDIALLEKEGIDFLFLPDVATLYPDGFASKISVGGVATKMEGASRPGHFDGVALIVSKLFNIISPRRAYFGQKDAQQCAVIEKLVSDLNFPCKIVIMPTSREADGLARSSRNIRLSEEERAKAAGIYQALQAAKRLFLEGVRDKKTLEAEMVERLHSFGITQIDYAVIVERRSFDALSPVADESLAMIAVKLGQVRLIDNELMG